MSPVTHLLGSWLIAAKVSEDRVDRRLMALAGILPDLDGFGLIVDIGREMAGLPSRALFQEYHHILNHGLVGALVTSAVLAAFARKRGLVFVWAFIIFHLHLVCDFLGSRGPSPTDVWPIHYFGPISHEPAWSWQGQWKLDGWQNKIISVSLLAASLWFAARWGSSVVSIVSQKADSKFVEIVRGWGTKLGMRH